MQRFRRAVSLQPEDLAAIIGVGTSLSGSRNRARGPKNQVAYRGHTVIDSVREVVNHGVVTRRIQLEN